MKGLRQDLPHLLDFFFLFFKVNQNVPEEKSGKTPMNDFILFK